MPLANRLGRRAQALIREPGDLPVTVVPQPGGVYRIAAWFWAMVPGPSALNGLFKMEKLT